MLTDFFVGKPEQKRVHGKPTLREKDDNNKGNNKEIGQAYFGVD
jgi:hypothetical protein